ncbi:uncharacterized protein LOC111335786 [Stylophora pistillata]|uniref:uncharacterized protein LOC111335786 n=1 Tax=Stylophora pistillata TaxID=50429 RepID=UPI000C0541DC|nr:uncharacterized protein LOC111335786 [Stylophora pistillata]
MATALTSTSLPSNSILELLPKLRPLDLSDNETCFSDGELTSEFDDCVSAHLETLAAKDKTIRDFLPIWEAQSRVKAAMGTFLKEEAAKMQRTEADKEEDDQDNDDSGERDSEEEQQLPIVFGPFMISKKDIMTKLEVRLFIFKLWLRRIEDIRKMDTKKCNSLQDFEHAIYYAQEITKDYREFIQKQFYDIELQQMLPHHKENYEKAWDETLEEKEKADFEMLNEDLEMFCSNTARICALLGLRLDFLDRLKEIPPEDCDHLKVCEWIITFLRNNYESAIPADRSPPSKELLTAVGFDPLSSSAETIMVRAGSTQHHIDACEMAEIFIRDQFKYNILLSPELSRFSLMENCTNTWFQLPEPTNDEEINGVSFCHVNIQNLVTKESLASSNIRSSLSGLVSKDDQNTVLFHGTDHLSACDILFRGIDLCQGRQRRDFSCGSGFYLTDNSEEALNWAQNTTAKPALLVFQVNRQEYSDNVKKLNLFENHQKWYEIVSSFRSGKKTAKTRKSLRAYDLIEGPVGTIRRNDLMDKITFEPKPSSYQMCLISDDFAESFRKTLDSIIFLDIC